MNAMVGLGADDGDRSISREALAASPAPGRPKAGEIPSGDRVRYAAREGRT